MKKIYFLIIISFCTVKMASAQTEKGTNNLGLDLGLSYQKNSSSVSGPITSTSPDTKTTNFNIGPAYSIFVAKNLDLGVALGYSYQDIQGTASGSTTLTTQKGKGFAGELYLRKYVVYDNKIGIRAGGLVGYGHTNVDYTYNYIYAPASPLTVNDKADNYLGALTLDVVYYPVKRLGVAVSIANLAYTHSKTTDVNSNSTSSTSNSSNGFNFNVISSNLTFSLYYVFGNK